MIASASVATTAGELMAVRSPGFVINRGSDERTGHRAGLLDTAGDLRSEQHGVAATGLGSMESSTTPQSRDGRPSAARSVRTLD